jgi:hypothetical protein
VALLAASCGSPNVTAADLNQMACSTIQRPGSDEFVAQSRATLNNVQYRLSLARNTQLQADGAMMRGKRGVTSDATTIFKVLASAALTCQSLGY